MVAMSVGMGMHLIGQRQLGFARLMVLDVRCFGGGTSLTVCRFIETGERTTRMIAMVLVVLSVWFVPVVTWKKAVTVVVAVCASNCVSAGLFGACRRTRTEQRCAFPGCLLGWGDRGGRYRGQLCGW